MLVGAFAESFFPKSKSADEHDRSAILGLDVGDDAVKLEILENNIDNSVISSPISQFSELMGNECTENAS